MKKMLVLADQFDGSVYNLKLISQNIKHFLAMQDVFIEPFVLQLSGLFEAMEFYPKFMDKYLNTINPILHYLCCEVISFVMQWFKKRLTPKMLYQTIVVNLEKLNTDDICLLQFYKYDQEFHLIDSKLHLKFLLCDFPELKKYHYTTAIIDSRYSVVRLEKIDF